MDEPDTGRFLQRLQFHTKLAAALRLIGALRVLQLRYGPRLNMRLGACGRERTEVVDYTFLALNMDRSLVKHSECHGRTVHCMLEPTFVSIAPPATVRISQSRRRVCGLRGSVFVEVGPMP